MAYNKKTWRNNELPVIGQTPINADRLNHMEQGILDAHTGNLTTQERNKLAGVEAGATVNSSDADLRNRATHTGIQPMSSVDGLEGALSSKANAADVMTAPERTKLTGIEAGATKNVPATDADVAAGTDEVSYITPKQLKTQIDNNPGPQGPEGPQGPAGTGVTILGSFDSPSELPPTGNNGDAFLVQGDLYVWSGTDWDNVGNIKGPEGSPGDAGVGINRIDVSYVVSAASVTAAPATGWVTTLPTVPKGQKLWTRMVSVLTNGNQTTAYTSAVQGADGADGAPGSSGVGVSNITQAYNTSAGGVTPPESGWQPFPVAPTNDRPYMWTRNAISLTNGNTSSSFSCARSGTDGAPGQPGANGVGISTATTAYQLSASGTTAPTGTWSSTPLVQTSALPFLWARTTTRYTDSSETLSYSVSRRGEDAPGVGNATTTVAGLVALADSADVVAGTPGKAVTTDVLKSTLDALPVDEGEGNTISVAFDGAWPVERPTQSADAVVLCLDPTGTADPPAWFIAGTDVFEQASGATARVYELAVRDGWFAMCDPALAYSSAGRLYIPDLLGGFSTPLRADDVEGVVNESGFGDLASVTGTSFARNMTDAPYDKLTLLFVSKFVPGADTQEMINGSTDPATSGSTYPRVLVPGGGTLPRVGAVGSHEQGLPMAPGVHVYDLTLGVDQITLRCDGQYIRRATKNTANLYWLRFGRNNRSETVATSLWRGGFGVILVRRDDDRDAVNRMRELLLQLGRVERMRPPFVPSSRILVTDRQGTVHVAKGDVDAVPDMPILSMTKMLNVRTACDILNLSSWADSGVLDEMSVVIQESDFLRGVPSSSPYPADRFRPGDVVTLRDLMYASAIRSDNDAPRALARALGELVPGEAQPRVKFLGQMQARLASWGIEETGARVEQVGGGAYMSNRHVNRLLFETASHDVTAKIFGTYAHTATIGGPYAREIAWTYIDYVEKDFRSNTLVWKGGSNGQIRNHQGMVWRDSSGKEYAVSVMGTRTNDPERHSMAYLRTEMSQAAIAIVEAGKTFIDGGDSVLSDPVNGKALSYDVTDLFVGAQRTNPTYGNSGIFLTVASGFASLDFYEVEITTPNSFVTSGFIAPLWLRPETDITRVLMRGARPFLVYLRRLSGTLGSSAATGFPVFESGGKNLVNGGFSWVTRAYREQVAPIPGVSIALLSKEISDEEGD